MKQEEKNYKKIIFLRHGRTNLNDNSFLGIKRDPEIIINKDLIKKIKQIRKENISLIFSSELKRSIQTAKLINTKKIIIDNYLNEKDYGKGENMTYNTLVKKFPYIKKAWNNKRDPKFPEGESDKDVFFRLKKFKKKLLKYLSKDKSESSLAVLTHNVVLRCLIGSEFQIPKADWHKIKIDHLEKIEFIYYQNKLLPNINREYFLGKVFK